MKTSKAVLAIIDDQAFMRRLAEAHRIKHNKKIVDADRYFHRVYGYLPYDLPDNTREMMP